MTCLNCAFHLPSAKANQFYCYYLQNTYFKNETWLNHCSFFMAKDSTEDFTLLQYTLLKEREILSKK